MDEPVFRLELLGSFRLARDRDVLHLTPSARRVVGLLGVHGHRTRTEAAGLLWLDLPQARAAANLRTVVWRLRQQVPGLLSGTRDSLDLNSVACDLHDVRAWTRQVLSGDLHEAPPASVTQPLLPEWDEDWLVEPREQLRLSQLVALEQHARRLLAAGRFAEACICATAAVGMDPLRESATRLLVDVHLREGNRGDAQRAYRRYEALLRSELGTQPSTALASLANAVLWLPEPPRPRPSRSSLAAPARTRGGPRAGELPRR